MLAYLLSRPTCRHDRDPRRHSLCRRSVGMALRLLCRLVPGECASGVAATFDHARAGFEQAWRVFLSKRTETDFQEWRDQRDWTARKYALWDAGKKLEPPSPGPGKPRRRFRECPSGAVFDMHRLHENLIHVPHINRAEAVHTQ